jgi:hypothetical protein
VRFFFGFVVDLPGSDVDHSAGLRLYQAAKNDIVPGF